MENKELLDIDTLIDLYNQLLQLNSTAILTEENEDLIKKRNDFTQSKNGIEYFRKTFIFQSNQRFNNTKFSFFDNSLTYDIPSQYLHFADDNELNMAYLYDINSGSICMWSFEIEDVYWFCSNSSSKFFKAMTIFIKTEIEVEKNKELSFNDHYLKSKYLECMDVHNNNPEFSSFYKYLFGI